MKELAAVSPAELLTIGEVAHRAGFATSALRYYERAGLLGATRTSGGQRRYPRHVLRRLAFVRAAQNVGLSLDEVREALAGLPDGRNPTVRDWARLSRDWRGRLDEQIAALENLRDGLTSCIGCGCLSLRTCALSNPRDEIAREGTGARYLPPSLRRLPPGVRARAAGLRGEERGEERGEQRGQQRGEQRGEVVDRPR